MSIQRQQVEHIAELARLALSDDELDRYAEQLADILAYITQLDDVDTTAVPPTPAVLPLKSVLRPDEARPSLPTEAALANAPAAADGQFRVAAILDASE